MQRYYGIWNPKTEMFVATYGTSTVPALYPTFGMAWGILKKRRSGRKKALWSQCEIKEVEVHVR